MTSELCDDRQNGGAVVWMFIASLMLVAHVSGPVFYWLKDVLN